MRAEVIHGDCLDVMRGMPDASVDAVVTDPPYGLAFMGKEWDHGVPGEQFWAEALRVAKPGAALLAFGGTRTFHRLACAIEDGGWEIRDCLSWLYGAGFPKSLNLDRNASFCACSAIPYSHGEDELRGLRKDLLDVPATDSACEGAELFAPVQREEARGGVGDARAQGTCGMDAGERGEFQSEDERSPKSGVEGRRDVLQDSRRLHGGSVRSSAGVGASDGTGGRLRDGAPAAHGGDGGAASGEDGGCPPSGPQAAEQSEVEPRTLAGQPDAQAGGAWPLCGGCGKPRIPRGLGTALKPAWEPVILARKPLRGTVAANVLRYRTGALNVEGCRIGWAGPEDAAAAAAAVGFAESRGRGTVRQSQSIGKESRDGTNRYHPDKLPGRWPANVCLDEEAARALDEQSGESAAKPGRTGTKGGNGGALGAFAGSTASAVGTWPADPGGGASRFFYTAKASRADREDGLEGMPRRFMATMGDGIGAREHNPEQPSAHVRNVHPTVKPTDLMRWLCRLVTPPGGTVLDPFCGSGSTGVAANAEGFDFIGIEREAEYVEIARRRIANVAPLFAEPL